MLTVLTVECGFYHLHNVDNLSAGDDKSDIANNSDHNDGENHLQLLLSFPRKADRMSSIRQACVLILLYVRHFFQTLSINDHNDNDRF